MSLCHNQQGIRLVEEQLQDESGQTRIMVIFPILGGVAIGGFAIHRLIDGQLLLAGFDFFVSIAFFSLSLYTYITRKDKLARTISAVLSVIGPLVLLKVFDGFGHYWLYSSSIVLYFLLSYPLAIAANSIMLLGVAAISVGTPPQFEPYAFLVTILLINLFSLLFALSEKKHIRMLEAMSMRDELTGIGNRRAFVEKINETVREYGRYQRNACLFYFDIDRFKDINDRFGHATGDESIRDLCRFVLSALRETDNVYRVGGDEFVIIAEATDEATALQLSEKIRQAVQNEAILDNHNVTISMGVTMIREDDTADSWIARADQALYQAKASGRNRVANIMVGEAVPG